MTDTAWRSVLEDPPPTGVVVEVQNNEGAHLVYDGRMWWLPDRSMYVYYTPQLWRPLTTTHLVTAAIAVMVEVDEAAGVVTYDDAVARVEDGVRRIFAGAPSPVPFCTGTLVSFCNHTDREVLFHPDGPCPPLTEESP